MTKKTISNLIIGVLFIVGALIINFISPYGAFGADQLYYTGYSADYAKWSVRSSRDESPPGSAGGRVVWGRYKPYTYGWEINTTKDGWSGTLLGTETWIASRFNTVYATSSGSETGREETIFRFEGWGYLTDENNTVSDIHLFDPGIDKTKLLRRYYVSYWTPNTSCDDPRLTTINELGTDFPTVCPAAGEDRGKAQEAIRGLNNEFYPSKWLVQGVLKY
ncbi:MAG: hypothetical protein NT135_00250 [Candidatus Berkelbacteria bacterium]|nr:hypothetical protein [Candidatus Berkelbacteria bacterium]